MEWKEVRIGEILNFRRGHDLPHSAMKPGKIPVAGSNGIIGYHDTATPIKPILTIGRSGNVGKPYFYEEAWAHNTTLYVDDFKGNDPKFLYYLCSTLPFANFGGGSAVPTLNRNHIHPIETRIPKNVSDQRRIASLLSSLDRKIETNIKINAELEEMAQAIFKNWFVDFEPFKDGKFKDSELGRIPEGWEVVSFSQFLKVSTEKVGREGVPEFSVTNTGIHPRDEKFTKNLSKSSAKNKMIRKDNLVFGMSRELLNWGIMKDEEGGVSSAYNVYAVDTSLINIQYLENFIKQRMDYFADLIKPASREGQGIDKALLMTKLVCIPPREIMDSFIEKYNAIIRFVKFRKQESRHLSTLRDTLLPRLMSGEIEIPE